MGISFVSVHEVALGAWQTYSQSHKVEVTKVTRQNGGDKCDLALSKFIMYTIFTISLSDFTLFAQNFILLAYVIRPEVKVI
jgi:hypothetical protein